MAVTPRLDLRQSQSLVMTPQLQQAIKLLQFNNLELASYIETQLEQNPLLKREEPGEGAAVEPAQDREAGGQDSESDSTDMPDSAEMASAEHMVEGQDAPLDMNYEGEWEDGPGSADPADTLGSGAGLGGGGSSSRSQMEGGDADLEEMVARPVSLRDHLIEQVETELEDPVDRLIAVGLIDLLDDAGYVSGPLDELAESLGCALARVEEVLARMQRFEPTGICALDLKECLALQLQERNRFDPAMQALVENLDLLARREAAQLMKLCKVDAEDLADMVAEIRTLNPKPALAFDAALAQPVTPDVFLRARNGSWVLELNTENLPRVLVDGQYYARVSREVRDKKEKDYIAECYQSANWLVRALHQRATTILRVAQEIVRQQDAFFVHGVQQLRPLVLRDIADAIEMHESTVSRVTSNKYIATPRGLFELKYFFTSAIASHTGDTLYSAEAVRHRIRSLIENESPRAVLSDDGIADILKKEGLDIARRTVAKYRESMRIPSSVQRRREKAMQL
ncbi:MAG: RNA polymerase factor sigma-54 [Alphaproteobacteria bacterium]|nr:RNA polymerase factor sigma-54 [Alphaproteobacteria bacterium]